MRAEGTYENSLGGHTYSLKLSDLSKQSAIEQADHLPSLSIKRNSIVKRTENFIIITGDKHYQDNTKIPDANCTKHHRFFIIPVSNGKELEQQQAEALLESAAQQHHIPSEFRLVKDLKGNTHIIPCIRFNFSEKNWQAYIQNNDATQKTIQPDTVPFIAQLQKLFNEKKTTYTVQ